MYIELGMSAQTLYAELLDQTRDIEMRVLATLSGAFYVKKIKGHEYVYFGYRDAAGSSQMIYVGPNDPRVQSLVSRFKEEKSYKKTADLVKAVHAMGYQGMMQKHFKITRQLSSCGFFKAGGVLVGTHAFLAIGSMLGIKWTSSNKTLDVDFAHAGTNLSVALPAKMKISVHDALTSLEMGLLPIQSFSGKAGAQYRNPSDPELRVDFLTPIGRHESVEIAELGLALEPLKFMEFSLEGTTQAVVTGRNDACIVNIPAPERFAVHKLIVYGERSRSDRVKSIKDIEQAAALIDWHFKNGMADSVRTAWEDARGRGPGWKSRIETGRDFMLLRHPDLSLLWHKEVE